MAIEKIKRAAGTLHFFFTANLMITDIGVAVICNGKAIVNLVMTIADPMREGTDCNIVAVTAFPVSANTITLAALYFDCLYSITAPHHHKRNIIRGKDTYWCYLSAGLYHFHSVLQTFWINKQWKKKGHFCGATLHKNFGLVFISYFL